MQLAALNAGPPPFDPQTWATVARRASHGSTPFRCEQIPDPLAQGFVGATTHLGSVDEVTLDNCTSAFYRFTFSLPSNATGPFLFSASANLDDQGVAFLNGNRITALMTAPSCDPSTGPTDPCYNQQDYGIDRIDSQGLRVLTAPSLDPLETEPTAYFHAGINELTFAVGANAAYYKPTGLEFAALITYRLRGDLNCLDGHINALDAPAFVLALVNPTEYQVRYPGCESALADINSDGMTDGRDIEPFVQILLSSDP